jgi:hypothetical protein
LLALLLGGALVPRSGIGRRLLRQFIHKPIAMPFSRAMHCRVSARRSVFVSESMIGTEGNISSDNKVSTKKSI